MALPALLLETSTNFEGTPLTLLTQVTLSGFSMKITRKLLPPIEILLVGLSGHYLNLFELFAQFETESI